MAETGHGTEVRLKKLHPFFSAPHAATKADNAVTPPTPDPSCSSASDESRADPVEYHNHHSEPHERKRKRRKTEPPSAVSKALPKATRAKRRTRVSAESNVAKHFEQDNVNSQQSGVEPAQDDGGVQEPPSSTVGPPSTQTFNSVAASGYRIVKDEGNRAVSQPVCSYKPAKLLKLNPATGTIGPPPASMQSGPTPTPTSGRKRGRKPKTLVVAVPYGTDVLSRERVGQRINEVLLGNSRIPLLALKNAIPKTPPSNQEIINDQASATTIPKSTPQKATTPNKPAHPFFQAKSKTTSSATDDRPKAKRDKTSSKRHVIFSSTPCSPKQTRPSLPSLSLPALSSKKSNPKMPRAQHPAWPWCGAVHVRDSLSPDLITRAVREPFSIDSRRRKAKGQAIHISEHESILCSVASKLKARQLADALQLANDQDFRPVPSSVRVPRKHFESGRKLQARVFRELRTLKNHDISVETHPAINHTYDSIATTLSAFDTSTCESLAWTQKYAPTSARCVLQNGREVELLRDWLQSLKVQAVDTGASDNTLKPKSVSAPKKKRRHKKLDGFIVSSDDEANEMDEIPDNEPQWLVHGHRSEAKKTVVRFGDIADRGGKPSGRVTNAVLLSGPHGCGKTATVYAIAKELDFEVFEINAGARRSGKDILERVGDMTRNHLVNHQQKDEYREGSAAEDEFAKELKSGKQGMMTSFFMPTSVPLPKEAQTVAQPSDTQVPSSEDKKPNRDQKQSLILLEEVDILFEEDKQFWATVISMIARSKRPFIMTCNNESVVPLQNLKLHGIFRFSSPPTELAADMLLLIAANEGHILERCAVKALYESRRYDLRAAIAELNYWCQIGVGDLRGGFDWFYPRWPKGSDVDEDGQTIRVVSQDTYHTGMGWLNRDLATVESTLSSTVSDLHQEAWNHWGIDVFDHHEFADCSSWVERATEKAGSRTARLALLQSIETFTDSVSDSDVCGPFLAPMSNRIALDATVPRLHAKTLDDFTVGIKVLETAPLCHYTSISLDVSASLRLLAQSTLMKSQRPLEDMCTTERFDEERVTSDIGHHFTSSARSEGSITRKDYSIAFDPIAASDKILANGYLDPSVFDREMTPLCLDVAPYVRSIVYHDQRLYNERCMRSSLLSEGGKPEKKRMRTTRAALSALEGGSRATTRRERYFEADINPYLVLRTGGQGWEKLGYRKGESGDHTSSFQENRDKDMDATSNQY
ncbi:hypothetical protein NUW58_g7630 [Xylaria curta]|uniref:Uncharacterized protein n=1 Tax=Xylaria curta TaxID=42375 RepID=A0ACC1NF99_9PEZI|nr:hypothetical protein NUW58_g7630 [Xylaria curta]